MTYIMAITLDDVTIILNKHVSKQCCEILRDVINKYQLPETPEAILEKYSNLGETILEKNRCLALTKTKEQCRRKCLSGKNYCKTHLENTPNGCIVASKSNQENDQDDSSDFIVAQIATEYGNDVYIDSLGNLYKNNGNGYKFIGKHKN